VRHDRGLGMKPTLDECGQRGDDVRVRVRADEPTQVLDTDDLVDLAHDLGSVEGRTGIDQHRLVALFHEVNVALELISRKQRTHPPDPWGQFDGARGVEGTTPIFASFCLPDLRAGSPPDSRASGSR